MEPRDASELAVRVGDVARRTSEQRERLLADVAQRVSRSTTADCVRVGIDGVDGAGKTTFADELADVLHCLGRAVVRVSTDDFHNTRAVRYRRGRYSPEGYWLDSYDYSSLRRDVLDPLGPSGSRRYRPALHDVESDAYLDLAWKEAAPGSVLIMDGIFLNRDELTRIWDFSIFLDVPFETTAERQAARDGGDPDPSHPSMARYVEGQLLYLTGCTPMERANLVIDNSDLDAPFIKRVG